MFLADEIEPVIYPTIGQFLYAVTPQLPLGASTTIIFISRGQGGALFAAESSATALYVGFKVQVSY
jgi:hypothetical protein